MNIIVRYTEESLFGDVDPEAENIDVSASMDQYNEMVKSAIAVEYPSSEIGVGPGERARVIVDDNADTFDALHIAGIEAGVWADWEWVVKNQA